MSGKFQRSNARFGIDIRGVSVHAEAATLEDIHSILHGHVGRVHIIDRQSKSLLLEGSIEQVRETLDSLTVLNVNGTSAEAAE